MGFSFFKASKASNMGCCSALVITKFLSSAKSNLEILKNEAVHKKKNPFSIF